MKNEKIIVLSGFARGGTNIAWNILQSHPDIVAPPCETGQLFEGSSILKRLHTGNLWKKIPLGPQAIDYMLYHNKMKTLHHTDNCYRSKDILYTKNQIQQSTLCLKSVNYDILLTDLLIQLYPQLYFIGLTRNGYSLADGYIRRGKSAGEAGRLYREIAEQMQRYATSIERFKIIKFEEVVQDPFGIAQELYRFVDATPHEFDKLRFKSKKTISKAGEHNVVYGSENRKYWFTRESISEILDPDIDAKQSSRLSNQEIKAFNHEAGTALEYFGYDLR